MFPGSSTWVEISKSAFDHNASQFKHLIGENNHLAFILKANGYGHGQQEIAQLAQQNPNISWLGVANLSDAITLRKASITKSILVTSCIDVDPQVAFKNNIDLAVFDMETAQKLNDIALAENQQFYVHIKFDTGLSRLGFSIEDATATLHTLFQLPGIVIRGIYSHFAESYKSKKEYTFTQMQRFDEILQLVKNTSRRIEYVHLANTAGTLSLSLPQCNLFRIGIGLYGYWSSPDFKQEIVKKYPDFSLKGTLTWKTKINSLKWLHPGTYVGYDRTYTTPRKTLIATIPIGYYDGYDFRLFNRSYVYIKGNYAPVIGRISMNLCTIDVTDIPGISLKEEVILMGDYEKINPYELGITAGNPNVREMTTKINPLIPRIIVP